MPSAAMSSQSGLFGTEGVERDHHQHLITGDRVEFAVGDDRLVVGVVERDGAQLLQRGMHPANLVEPGQEWLQRFAIGQRRLEISASLLFRVQVLLAAVAHRPVLEQLVTGVHAPRRAHRRRQHRPDGSVSGAAVLQAGMQDVGSIDEQIRPGVVGVLGDLPAELGEFDLDVRQVKYV